MYIYGRYPTQAYLLVNVFFSPVTAILLPCFKIFLRFSQIQFQSCSWHFSHMVQNFCCASHRFSFATEFYMCIFTHVWAPFYSFVWAFQHLYYIRSSTFLFIILRMFFYICIGVHFFTVSRSHFKTCVSLFFTIWLYTCARIFLHMCGCFSIQAKHTLVSKHACTLIKNFIWRSLFRNP